MESSCVQFLSTKRGKPCIVVDDYQFRQFRENENSITWVCLKERKANCKGRVKTDRQFQVLSKTPHNCIPNAAEIEIKKKLEKCRNRVREDISVPVHKIFREEMAEIYMQGYDLYAPKYENVKTTLCSERRKALGKTKHPSDSKEVEEVSDSPCREGERKKYPIPLEPIVTIQEGPLDYNQTPSTSTEADNEEFILPHENNTSTSFDPSTTDPTAAPQVNLSSASLVSPEFKTGELVRKKRKITRPTFATSTNDSESSPVSSFSESSNPGASTEPQKDQLDAFGVYIVAKLRSLDKVSRAYAQKAIGDIVFEAEMGKFLNK